MRPKKRVLLLNEDEAELGVMRLVFETHGYAVRGEIGAGAAYEEARVWLPELLMASWPMNGGFKVEALFSAVRRSSPATALLLIAPDLEVAPIAESMGADFVLRGQQCAPAMILEAAKRMAARKRGPRMQFACELTAREVEDALALRTGRGPVSERVVWAQKTRVA